MSVDKFLSQHRVGFTHHSFFSFSLALLVSFLLVKFIHNWQKYVFQITVSETPVISDLIIVAFPYFFHHFRNNNIAQIEP